MFLQKESREREKQLYNAVILIMLPQNIPFSLLYSVWPEQSAKSWGL